MWGCGMCFPEEGKGPEDRIPNIQHFISGLTDTASEKVLLLWVYLLV